jgi:hypothetical protein
MTNLKISSMEERETPYGNVAMEFVIALVTGKFENAHFHLSSALRKEWTPDILQDTYSEMIEYFQSSPNEISLEVVDTSSPYAESDRGWVYIAINEDGNGEAVTVIVGNEDGKYLIQELEWRRP